MIDREVSAPPHSSGANADYVKQIIVVGAGLAGLATARTLTEQGYEVVVIEGRDRIGGRCYTRDGIDEGAHWIHSTDGNPITTLARELSVDTLFVGGDSTYCGGWEALALYGPSGSVLTGEEKLKSILCADEIRDELEALRRRHVAEGSADMSLHGALQQVLVGQTHGDMDQRAVAWHSALLARDDCAADDETLSFLEWDEGYEVYGYGDSVFLKGYGAIVAALASGLDIRLEHVVASIQYDDPASAPVKVTTNRGVFEGDAVVVTLPLGVLKAGTVAFEPPLPMPKRDAISRLGVGELLKVTVFFDAPFWPRNQYIFGCYCDPVEEYPTTIVNLWKTLKLPVLQMLIGGDKGRAIERWTEDQTHAWTLKVLQDVFGEQVPEPCEIRRTNWDRDPFSRGTYSYIAVGSSPADMETLAEPIDDRVFFAGEATYRHHWACTHGAYVSGLRAAARITGDATMLPPRNFTENRRWREMMMRASRFFNAISTSISGQELKQRLAVLEASEVFSSVPETELALLAMMFEPVEFADGQVICCAGDRAQEVYAVAGGTIEVRQPDGSLLLMLERGAAVGEYGMFGDGA